jgi:anti-sigma factor RsiW
MIAHPRTLKSLEAAVGTDDRISEEEISRFLDGELSPTQRATIQARLALRPQLAADVFAEAHRMDALRAAQPQRLFPPRASLDGGKKLQRALQRQKVLSMLRLQLAAAVLVALGWAANSLTEPLRQGGQTVDENFILSAREALRVAQLDAASEQDGQTGKDKIERLVGAINIEMPQLPSAWQVTDVQVQPWEGKQRLVVRADTPTLGQVTLVAAPMSGEDAVPPTSAADGRIPTVYWQSGGTAYALMGPAGPERLEREAKGIEVATRKNVGPKIRG